VARRHLRHFTSSALSYALAEDGKENHPRIFLFCILLGIIIVSPATEFNPRLSAEYFQPALRTIFPNPKIIEELLGDGTGDGVLVMKQCIEKAAIPLSLHYSLGGDFAISHFQEQMKEMCLEKIDLSKLLTSSTNSTSMSSTTSNSLVSYSISGGIRKKNYMVNFDEAMLVALDMWLFSDSLRIVRERVALQTFKKFLDRYVERKGLTYSLNVVSEGGDSFDDQGPINNKKTTTIDKGLKSIDKGRKTSINKKAPLRKSTTNKSKSIKESSSTSQKKTSPPSSPSLSLSSSSSSSSSPLKKSGVAPKFPPGMEPPSKTEKVGKEEATTDSLTLNMDNNIIRPSTAPVNANSSSSSTTTTTTTATTNVQNNDRMGLSSPDHRQMLNESSAQQKERMGNNLLPELNNENSSIGTTTLKGTMDLNSNAISNQAKNDGPNTPPLKTLFRKYSQDSFAKADLLRSHSNTSQQLGMPSPSPSSSSAHGHLVPMSPSTTHRHQSRPYLHQSSYSSVLMSPKREHSGLLSPLPLDFTGKHHTGLGAPLNSRNSSGSDHGVDLHNIRGGGGNVHNNMHVLSPPSLHPHHGVTHGNPNSLPNGTGGSGGNGGGGKRVVVVESENAKCDEEVFNFLVDLKLEKYSPIFAVEEIDMECLLVMTESDLKDLELSKGARVKILRATTQLSNQQ
jgi:hypothetical protein